MSNPPATSFPNSPGWSRLIERLRAATAGRFTIVRELGRGGFAAVFLAQQHQPSRPVAIKLLLPSHLDSEWALEHFRGESQKIANWRHQSVVTIYEVHEVDDLFFFVMSYVEGGSLHDLIAVFGQLSVAMTRSVLAQMGSALQYAHRQGVTHRDIKPQNVLIDTDGGAVVTDFGISKQSGGTSHTVTGMIFGTAPYMAPEQCESGTTSILSDQYALGIVAYEMLTGNAPFLGTATSVLLAHLQKQVPPIRLKRNDVPPDLEAAVSRMLDKDPAKRFPSIAEAMHAAGAVELSDSHPDRIAFALAARRISAESRTQKLDIVSIPPVLEVGDLVTITATARTSAGETLADAPIDWRLSNGELAHVDKGNGTLTALVAGVTTLYVRSGKVEQQIQIEIRAPRASTVELSGPSDRLRVGDVKQLEARARSKAGITVSSPPRWMTSDPAIATVSDSGEVRALKSGRALIKAQIDEVTSELWLDIAPPPVADLRVSWNGNSIETGDSRQLRAVAVDAADQVLTDRTVVWNSSDRRIATVTASGLLTGVAVGNATITAACEARTSAHALDVRLPRAASVEVLAPSSPVKVGDRVRLNARVRGAGGDLLERLTVWLSDDATIASIDAAGTLSAIAPGSVIISATVDDVSGATMIDVAPRTLVTPVVAPPVAPVSVPPAPPVAAAPAEVSFTEFFAGGPVGTSAPPPAPAPSQAPPPLAPPASAPMAAPMAEPMAAPFAAPLPPPPVSREQVLGSSRDTAPRHTIEPPLESSRIFVHAPLDESPVVGSGAIAPPAPPAPFAATAPAPRPAAPATVTGARPPALPSSLRRVWIVAGVVVLVVGGIAIAMKSGTGSEGTGGGVASLDAEQRRRDSIAQAAADSINAARIADSLKALATGDTGKGKKRALPTPVVPVTVVDLRVSQTALTLDQPQTAFDVSLVRDGKRQNTNDLRVTSRDPSMASIRDRMITAHKAGQVWIVATNGALRDSVQLTVAAPAAIIKTQPGGEVVVPPTVATIQLTPIAQLERNQVRNIDVTTLSRDRTPMSLNALAVHSSDPSVVEASKTNAGIRLVARNSGTATIVVRADNAPPADFSVTVPAPPPPPPDTTTRPPPPANSLSMDEARTIVRSWIDRSGKALPSGLSGGALNDLKKNLDGMSWPAAKSITPASVTGNTAQVVVIWEGPNAVGSMRRLTANIRAHIEGGRVTSAELIGTPTNIRP